MSFAAPVLGLVSSGIGLFNQLNAADSYDESADQQRLGARELEAAARLQEEAAALIESSVGDVLGAAEEVDQAAFDQVIAARLLERSAGAVELGGAASRKLAELNAAFDEQEVREDVRRLRYQYEKEKGAAVAVMSASGLALIGSPNRRLGEMDRVLEDEVGWIHRGLRSRTAIGRFEGNINYLSALAEADAVRSQAQAGIAAGRGTYASARQIRAQADQLRADALSTRAGAKQTRAQAKSGRAGATETEARKDQSIAGAIGTGLGAVTDFGNAFNWWQPTPVT